MAAMSSAPQAILDAGGDASAILSAALYRCTDEMQAGQVLHVISQNPSTRIHVRDWCCVTGHELLRTQEDGNETLFWIRKC